jgi:hypothetical protein
VTNHSEQQTVTARIPWAGGRTIRELTAEETSPREYRSDETTTFETESVNVYALQDE